MRIGELARRTGATPGALRYYERQGLLRAARAENGYRDYDPASVTVVRNIRTLLLAGLTSDDIRQLGSCLDTDLTHRPLCPEAAGLYRRRLETVEGRIEDLVGLRARLRDQLHGGNSRNGGAARPVGP